MTPQEINDYYGIDITSKKRDSLLVYLRSIYVQENRNIHVAKIARSLKKDRTTIIHLIKSYESYIKDPFFSFVYKCYITQDKDLLKKCNHFLSEKLKETKDYNNLKIKKRRLSKPKKEKTKKVDKLPNDFKRPHIFEVAKNLRKIDTRLNNKIYKDWNVKDFKKYFKLINNETSTK